MTDEIKEKPKVNINLNNDPEKNEKADLEAPEDRFYIVYFLFFFLGIVYLLPWTFFNNAIGFWMYKFRNTTINETDSEFRTNLQAQFNSSINITNQIAEVAFLIIGLLFGRLIQVRIRFIGVLSIILLLFVVLTAFIKIDTDSWQEEFFALALVITFCINAMNAVLSITLYTTVANFPHHYLAPYLTGSGLSRTFTSLLQIISLGTGLSVQDSAIVYFSMGIFVIGFTLVFVVITTGHNQFYLYYMRNYTQGQEEKRVSFKEGIPLFKKVWSGIAMVGLYIFATNMSPIALVVSEGEGNGPWNDIYFVPTITFLLGAVCDLIGRSMSFRFAPDNMPGIYWVLISVVRTVALIPLFLLCNAQPRHHLPVLIPYDYQYIIITIVAGVSGGYFVSRASYNVAQLVTKEELKNAYHVQMVCIGIEMGVLSFLGTVAVDIL